MKPLCVLFAGAISLFAQSGDDQSGRLLNHDRNGDGVVDRREWRGGARAFERHDWNRDGVLSGDELDGSRNSQTRSRTNETAGRLDKNRSGVVEGYEWPYNAQVFHELDKDADSVLSPDELRNISSATLPKLDRNRDGRIDEEEWPGGFAEFGRLDNDRDGRISSEEYFGRGGEWQRRQRFDAWDRNRDGTIQPAEWQSSRSLFQRLDTNRDSALSWDEFMASTERYDRPYGWR